MDAVQSPKVNLQLNFLKKFNIHVKNLPFTLKNRMTRLASLQAACAGGMTSLTPRLPAWAQKQAKKSPVARLGLTGSM
ncbi:MAG: hypothetical protein V4573_01420, partial [Pseudomonadota bacterium]